ncbi:MAG: hypothetical protein ACKPKO_30590, partial [Candidatus Fonsibacter sp.]
VPRERRIETPPEAVRTVHTALDVTEAHQVGIARWVNSRLVRADRPDADESSVEKRNAFRMHGLQLSGRDSC